MAIVKLKKITLYAPIKEKAEVLEDLQKLGCLHIIPLVTHKDLLTGRSSFLEIRDALKYLQSCPTKLKALKESTQFEPALIQAETLKIKRESQELTLESDSIKKQIEELRPWGNFILPEAKEIGEQKLWFYRIPHKEMQRFNYAESVFYQVNQDAHFCYVVLISPQEPKSLPGMRVKCGEQPLIQLEKRFEQIEERLEDLQLERIHLTRWLYLFEKNLHQLEDTVEMDQVTTQTYDVDQIFALQAWIFESEIKALLKYAAEKKLALDVKEPAKNETPPTLLKNKPFIKEGEDLLSFYMTPSYWLWDPSAAIFFSFAVFFAMIFSDAGYALLLGGILLYFWKKLGMSVSGKRFRALLVALTLFSFIWGVVVGSYFGIAIKPSSFLNKLKLLDMQNYSTMMAVAIGVGVIHIIFANLALAWSLKKSTQAFAPIGWAVALAGAYFAFIGAIKESDVKIIGFWMIGFGLILVLLFSSSEKKLWKRIVKGSMALARVPGLFGDVLSYLRLFALGLASASLATVFNQLAKQVYEASFAFKIVFFLLIILIGHAINFLLAIMSGFIHGLRLNFIEFFNWSLPDEGTPFRAFAKKEKA